MVVADQMDQACSGCGKLGKWVGVEFGEMGVIGRSGQPEENVRARGRGILMGVGVEEEERVGDVATLFVEVGVDKTYEGTPAVDCGGNGELRVKGGGELL